MTEANARHHLGILRQQGLVTVVGQRPPDGKGRPILLYSPTQQTSSDNLTELSSALLQELLADHTPSEMAITLQRVAHRMQKRSSAPVSGSRHLTQRLLRAIQQLNAWHYQARWEAHATAPRLTLGHCPYAAILPEHPELCNLDKILIEEMLAAPVEQLARLEMDARGLPQCVFAIRTHHS